MAIVAIMLINIVNGDINCNDQGVCTGDGNPSADVRCGGEYSLPSEKSFPLNLILRITIEITMSKPQTFKLLMSLVL